MSRVLITGSADGLGQAAARMLADRGHFVTLHARNAERAQQAHNAVPKAERVLIADISTIEGVKSLASQANEHGPWDTIVHNAGVGLHTNGAKNVDGIATLFAINSLAPYILTCLVDRPKRLLYISSGLHSNGSADMTDIGWKTDRRWNSVQAYSDSKLHGAILAMAVARLWPDVQSCALDPGWVKTKLGGYGAPGALTPPAQALAAYASGELESVGSKSGIYFMASGPREPHRIVGDTAKQDEFLGACEKLSGLSLQQDVFLGACEKISGLSLTR